MLSNTHAGELGLAVGQAPFWSPPRLVPRLGARALRLTLLVSVVFGLVGCSDAATTDPSDDGGSESKGRCAKPVKARGSALTIDDFSSQDLVLPTKDGREQSPWSSSPTGNTTLDAASGALHFSTPESADWTSFSVQLVGAQGCYDASAYAGLRLKFKLGADAGVGPGGFKFGVGTPPSTPVEAGGECSVLELCYDHFAHVIAAEQFSRDYQTLEVLWPEFFQAGWGWAAEPLYKLEKHELSLIFGGMDQGHAYDIWVDDIEFIERAPTP